MVIRCKMCGKEVVTKFSGKKYCKECAEKARKANHNRARAERRKNKKLEIIKQKSPLLSKYLQLVKEPEKKYSLCWDCKNAYGGCSWTEVDQKTNKILFQPVEGWRARKTRLNSKKLKNDYSYFVYECPLFELEQFRRKENGK